jgi:hypothetical protein
MARARNIKPGTMDNEMLAALPALHRLLWIYMWMLADREGRLEDRPARIKVKALPYDEAADVDAMLTDLHDSGFIARYCVDGRHYIQIINFGRHQKPHANEVDSVIPPMPAGPAPVSADEKLLPSGNGLLTLEQSASNLDDKDLSPKEQPLGPDCLIADCLIADCLIAGGDKSSRVQELKPRAKKRTRGRVEVFDAKAHLEAQGADPQLTADWLTLRAGKRAKPTATAIAGIEREAAKAGITLADALRICCERGWAGFEAKWLDDDKPRKASGPGPPGSRAAREGAALWSLGDAALNAMGRDLGIGEARPGEAKAVYIGRIEAAQAGRNRPQQGLH